MRLMYLICIVVAQLVYDFGYSIMVTGGESLSYECFKFKGTTLPLIIELVCQSLLDIWIHDCAGGEVV
jgi:hypothetical protein